MAEQLNFRYFKYLSTKLVISICYRHSDITCLIARLKLTQFEIRKSYSYKSLLGIFRRIFGSDADKNTTDYLMQTHPNC